MVRSLLWVLAVLSASGCGQCGLDPLVGACTYGEACAIVDGKISFELPENTCQEGRIVCDGEKSVCAGFRLCGAETCNGIDDNGDGQIDEAVSSKPADGACPTENIGTCRSTTLRCIDGRFQCHIDQGPQPEICDGKDNDCDGVADDDIEATFSYPADQFPNTVGVGECAPGINACMNGVEIDIPPTIPRSETGDRCGNGKDDDCDGYIDDSETRDAVAVSFVTDVSGSMGPHLPDVRQGFCNTAQEISTRTFGQSRFALTVYGFGDAADRVTHAEVVQDFTDADTFCIALVDYVGGLIPSADEWQLEGILKAASVAWPEGMDRHVVLAGDEELHPLLETVDQGLGRVIDSCTASPWELHLFFQRSFVPDWSDAMLACGGHQTYDLDAVEFAEGVLEPELSRPCQ